MPFLVWFFANNIGLVRTRVLPNGGKLSYGYDASGRVTSVSQSTAEGESNQTTKKYEQNCITHLTSGKNVAEYEYDHKRRIKCFEWLNRLVFFVFSIRR